jgi:glycosyltransferase involved in cell wall biosynthesis
MPDSGAIGQCRVLALLWHAPHEVIAAGGFRRTFEVFKRAPEDIDVIALDDFPTFLRGIDQRNIHVLEYRIPSLVRKLEQRYFWFERALEWMFAAAILSLFCAKMRACGERFDVVFVPSSEQIPALIGGIVAKRLFGASLVACNLNIDIFPARTRKTLARLHNSAACVIAISEHLAKQLRFYGVRSPMVVNGVGLDTAVISDVPDPDQKERVFDAVFVGRHDSEKGVFDLIKIWNIVTSQKPAAKLLMIGSCNPKNGAKLSSLIQEYGLEDNVTMMGTVGDDEKYSLMKRSKVCVFPSYVEEWGLVPMEALACGLPVVVYDLPVYAENIASCPAAFRVRVGDLESIARVTLELLTDNKYSSVGQLGPACVQGFGWEEIAEREFQILLGSCSSPMSSAPADLEGL